MTLVSLSHGSDTTVCDVDPAWLSSLMYDDSRWKRQKAAESQSSDSDTESDSTPPARTRGNGAKDRGPKGPHGERGGRGAQGHQGARGEQGVRGPPGVVDSAAMQASIAEVVKANKVGGDDGYTEILKSELKDGREERKLRDEMMFRAHNKLIGNIAGAVNITARRQPPNAEVFTEAQKAVVKTFAEASGVVGLSISDLREISTADFEEDLAELPAEGKNGFTKMMKRLLRQAHAASKLN